MTSLDSIDPIEIDFEVPEALENEEFNCVKRRLNSVGPSDAIDYDDF